MGEVPDQLAGRAFKPDKPDADQLVNLDNEADQAVLHRDRIRAAATAATAETLRAPRRGWKASLAAILADLRAVLRIPGQIRQANDRGFPAIGIRNEDLATEATAEGRFVFLSLDRFGRVITRQLQPSNGSTSTKSAISVPLTVLAASKARHAASLQNEGPGIVRVGLGGSVPNNVNGHRLLPGDTWFIPGGPEVKIVREAVPDSTVIVSEVTD